VGQEIVQINRRAVIEEAQRLYQQKDESALEMLVGMRSAAIDREPSLVTDVSLEPKYEMMTIGPLHEIKVLALRIINRWNKELYSICCDQNAGHADEDRKAILNSLNMGEAAVVAAVTGALLALSVPAPVAAALAAVIVKRFIWPAKEELCNSWAGAIVSRTS
jgi:hypothetical protein